MLQFFYPCDVHFRFRAKCDRCFRFHWMTVIDFQRPINRYGNTSWFTCAVEQASTVQSGCRLRTMAASQPGRYSSRLPWSTQSLLHVWPLNRPFDSIGIAHPQVVIVKWNTGRKCVLQLFPHVNQLSCDMTKPAKWRCAQRRLRSAWASARSDQSLRCPLEECLGP